MLNENYQQFLTFLDNEDKDNAVGYALDLLAQKQITLQDLYYNFLTPSLNDFVCKANDESICIWKEHTRTSIIRTILESTYSFVAKNRKPSNNKKVLVLCPPQEYHEIGAIIATHVLTLYGFDATYIGANTPKEDIYSAVRALKPDYLALSVTNYYNLFVTKTITEYLKEEFPHVKIVLGGSAFTRTGAKDQITYDYIIQTESDIEQLAKEVNV